MCHKIITPKPKVKKMAEKVYLNATELQKRWGISAQVFAEMKKDKNLPVNTVLHKATLYHMTDIFAFEEKQRADSASAKHE